MSANDYDLGIKIMADEWEDDYSEFPEQRTDVLGCGLLIRKCIIKILNNKNVRFLIFL